MFSWLPACIFSYACSAVHFTFCTIATFNSAACTSVTCFFNKYSILNTNRQADEWMTLYRKTPGVRGGFHSSVIDCGFCAVARNCCTASARELCTDTHQHSDYTWQLVNNQQVYAQPPPSALNMTLPTFAAERHPTCSTAQNSMERKNEWERERMKHTCSCRWISRSRSASLPVWTYFSLSSIQILAFFASNTNLLTRPAGITSNFSYRAFSVSASSTWNSLPAHIRSIDTLSTFKRHLKFHLFQSAFTV